MECKLEMILIEKNGIKNDNIENNLILDELIYNCEIAKDKTTFEILKDVISINCSEDVLSGDKKIFNFNKE